MKGQNIKKGDTVCIINTARNDYEFVTETKVTSAGSKFIVTECSGNSNKFDSDTHRSEYLGYIIYKGAKDECEQYIKDRNEAKKLVREIIHYLEWCEPDPKKVKEIYNMLSTIVKE
jgi:hypothetical protein